MQKFDFNKTVDRRKTGSYKWDIPHMRGVLPMWIADMDFPAAQEILDAIQEKINHGVFGYAIAPDSLIDIVVERMDQLYQWKIKPEWLIWLPGLETSFALASSSLGDQGDGVMCFTPIYPPFYASPRAAHREAIKIPLLFDGSSWKVDYEAIEKALSEKPAIKLLLFCNPHNPIGKVFSREELMELGQFCLVNNIKICSDEVHCDLILNGRQHIPLATLSPEIEAQSITLMAPSKTFNIAGLGCGFAIIPDSEWRQSFKISMRGVSAMVNNLGYVACEAAYRYAEPWRLALLEHLKSNLKLIENYLGSKLMSLKWVSPEATYLAWLDANHLGSPDPAAIFKKYGVGLSPGHIFGSKGWVRLNYACSESNLLKGLDRMSNALAAEA